MSHTTTTIYAFIETLTPLYDLLLASGLTTADRQSCGTHCFEQAPELVRDTAAVLRDSGSLFPEIATDPESLASQQEDADAVRALQAHMLFLASLSADASLCLQARATRASLTIFRHAQSVTQFQPEQKRRFRQIALSRIAIHVPRQHRTRLAAAQKIDDPEE